jgi:hypothetical protein
MHISAVFNKIVDFSDSSTVSLPNDFNQWLAKCETVIKGKLSIVIS